MINILMSRSTSLNSSYAKAELSKILKKEMKVLVVGFSFFGNLSKEDYFNYYGLNSEYDLKLRENFLDYQITNLDWLYYYDTLKEEAVKLINEADILYFPGGAPDLMFERIKEKDLLEELKNFNKIIIGSSAGAMIQLSNYHISIDNEYDKFSLNQGLGYISDFFIEVHFRRRKKQKSSMRKMRKTFKKSVYVIPDDGMIILNNKKVHCLGNAQEYYNKKGITKK